MIPKNRPNRKGHAGEFAGAACVFCFIAISLTYHAPVQTWEIQKRRIADRLEVRRHVRLQNNRRSSARRETRSCRNPSMSVHIVQRSARFSRSRLPVHSHVSRGRSRSHSKARLLPHHLHVLLPHHLMRWIAPSAAEAPLALGERVAFKGVTRVSETYAVVFAQRLQRLLTSWAAATYRRYRHPALRHPMH